MSTYAFNTLEQAENLQKHGFDEKQAKGLIEIIALITSNQATKDDLERFQTEIRTEFRLELQLEIAKLDKKIMAMTVSFGVVMVAALGAYTYLLQWLN